VPAATTSITLPVEPLLQLNVPTHPLAVNVAFSPSQQIVLLLLMLGADGLLFWLITIGLLTALLPHSLLHVAVYVPATLTVITLVLEPLLHDNVPTQPLAVKVAVSFAQIPVLFELNVGADGLLPTFITISFDFGLTPHIVSHTTV
jgi:hypothetical protein